MRTITSILSTLTFAASFGLFACACGGDDDAEHEEPDAEGCEHLTEGPYQEVSVSAARDAAAPWVAANHQSYTIALLQGAPGYVTYDSTLEGDAYLFLDQSVGVKVFTSDGTEVALESSATSSEACAAIKGRHVVEVGVGVHYIELTAGDGLASVNLVIEASDHGH
jgi:hypothetical protein